MYRWMAARFDTRTCSDTYRAPKVSTMASSVVCFVHGVSFGKGSRTGTAEERGLAKCGGGKTYGSAA